MTYQFAVREEERGYSAWCLDLEGCRTQADSITELERNAAEALDLYLDETPDSRVLPPLPNAASLPTDGAANADAAADSAADWLIDVPVAPGRALALQLKHHRAAHRLSQADMATRLEMKNVYSYQRLERKANPRLSTLARLERMVPELSLDWITETSRTPRPLRAARRGAHRTAGTRR